MPIDGMFVGKLAQELNHSLTGGRVDAIDALNKTDYVFQIRVPGQTLFLYLSVSYNNPTIFATPSKFEKPTTASSFAMLLRKHLYGAYVIEVNSLNHDRIIEIDFEAKNEMLGSEKKALVIELIGRFANLLLLDSNRKIIDAIKQLSVLENNSRGIMRGLEYTPLLNNKMSPEDEKGINERFGLNENLFSKNIVDSISGISPSLANYLISKYTTSKDDFFSFFKKETNAFDPVMTDKDYYYFNIFSDNADHYKTLSDLLFAYYQKYAQEKILRDNNAVVYQTVSNNLKRVTKKLVKLSDDLENDKNAEELRLKGEILLANIGSNIPRSSSVTLDNYYDGSKITIQIDPAKSIKDNSNQYFKKYRKEKIAIEHLSSQIQLAQDEKEYLELLSYQLEKASLKDIIEIKNELISNGYIIEKTSKTTKKRIKPNYLEFNIDDCHIFVGKNNLQNDYITHALAKKDDLWFHVKADHGSHVVVSGTSKYSERVIRFAAKLAAMYSEASDSSSVPVNYTEVKYLKKVPGRKGSFVTYSRYKTIYIDPKRED